MRRSTFTFTLGLALVIALVQTNSAHAQAPAPVRPAAQIFATVEALYISEFRNEVGMTDEQFAKVLPMLRGFLRNRADNAQRRQTLTERRNTLLAGNPSEEEVRLLSEQINQAEQQRLNFEKRFLTGIDAELSAVQRLKVRAFQDNFDQRLLRFINLAREAVETRQQQQQQNRQQSRPARPQRGTQTDALPR